MKTYRLLAAAVVLTGFGTMATPAWTKAMAAQTLQGPANGQSVTLAAGGFERQSPASGRMERLVDSSCTTTCGSGPDGTCSKSCPAPQNCLAHCEGGKATCECH